MKIDYKITKYFEDNNLFDDTISDGLKIVKETDNSLLISGSSVDLVNLADLLVNLALNNEKGAHIHMDNLSLIDNNSDYKDIIIEKVYE